jgi:hypothetical protein
MTCGIERVAHTVAAECNLGVHVSGDLTRYITLHSIAFVYSPSRRYILAAYDSGMKHLQHLQHTVASSGNAAS